MDFLYGDLDFTSEEEDVIIGCDGSFCEDPETQQAYPLSDMPGVYFCPECQAKSKKGGRENGKEVQTTFTKIHRMKPRRTESWM